MLRDHSAMMQNEAAPRMVQGGPMFDWNDLRYFLAVAETGSTLAAGRALRVSQATVARRVAALERALGRRPARSRMRPPPRRATRPARCG